MRNFLLYLALFLAMPCYGQQWTDTSGRIEITRTPSILNPVFFYTPDPNFYIRIDTGLIIPNAYKLDLHLPEAKPYNWKRGALVFGLGAISGTAYGFHEVSVHKPWMFPVSWNREWWHEQAAWRNKYKNGDPSQGPKYFGSTSFFVAPTSAKHTFGTVHRAGLLATGITIGFGEKRPLWHYAVDLAAGFLGYTTMFHLTYSEGVFFGRN